MPRIANKLVSDREKIAFQLLKDGESVKSVNNHLGAIELEDGTKPGKMNLARIYQLKAAVAAGLDAPPARTKKAVATPAATVEKTETELAV